MKYLRGPDGMVFHYICSSETFPWTKPADNLAGKLRNSLGSSSILLLWVRKGNSPALWLWIWILTQNVRLNNSFVPREHWASNTFSRWTHFLRDPITRLSNGQAISINSTCATGYYSNWLPRHGTLHKRILLHYFVEVVSFLAIIRLHLKGGLPKGFMLYKWFCWNHTCFGTDLKGYSYNSINV